MTAVAAVSGYFIADDAYNVPHLWRERGEYPVPIIGRDDLRDDPEVWEALVAWAGREADRGTAA